MPEKIRDVSPPRGWQRLLWRAPIWVYRFRLGWILGGRFMLLNHIGRRSGLARQTVVEVVKYSRKTRTYYAASGFGRSSDWYQNVRAKPEVTIQVGSKTLAVRAVPLPPEQSGRMMATYARRNATAARGLMKLIGYRVSGDDSDYFAVGRDLIPFVAFEPRASEHRRSSLPTSGGGGLLPGVDVNDSAALLDTWSSTSGRALATAVLTITLSTTAHRYGKLPS